MLEKYKRLIKRKEFAYIYKNGETKFYNCIKLYYIPTKLNHARIGFSVNNKIGDAVLRNKIKRRLREIVRLNYNLLNQKYNYIFKALNGIENLTYWEMEEQLLCVIKKAKLLNDNSQNSENFKEKQ